MEADTEAESGVRGQPTGDRLGDGVCRRNKLAAAKEGD